MPPSGEVNKRLRNFSFTIPTPFPERAAAAAVVSVRKGSPMHMFRHRPRRHVLGGALSVRRIRPLPHADPGVQRRSWRKRARSRKRGRQANAACRARRRRAERRLSRDLLLRNTPKREPQRMERSGSRSMTGQARAARLPNAAGRFAFGPAGDNPAAACYLRRQVTPAFETVMPDLLLEFFSEEIPARMQARAAG